MSEWVGSAVARLIYEIASLIEESRRVFTNYQPKEGGGEVGGRKIATVCNILRPGLLSPHIWFRITAKEWGSRGLWEDLESDLSSSPLWPSLVPKSFSVLILSLKETEAVKAETDELGDADTGWEFMYTQARAAAAVAQIPTKLELTHSHIHTHTHTHTFIYV